MDLPRILERIERRLKAVGKTANAVSKEAGKPDAIRNIRRAVESGDGRGVTLTTTSALAPPLRTTLAWLTDGAGAEEVGDPEHTIPVWGRASAGGAIYNFHENDAPIDRINAPIGADDHTGAIEIAGESLGRIFNGWYAIYNEVRLPPTDDMSGELCVVETAAGNVFIKRLKKGRGKRWTLESNYEAPVENVIVRWAAKVLTIVPR